MFYNDPNGLRREVTHKFIDRLTDNDMAAVIGFDYKATVLEQFTSNKEKLHDAVDKIRSDGGTNIGRAVSIAYDLFNNLDNNRKEKYPKFLILLTDGDGDYSEEYTILAKKAGIKIYTIGLGNGVSEKLLKDIAKGTDGEYFHAKDASKLNKIFEKIADKTDLYKDSDGDGIKDYYEKEMDKGHLRLGTGIALTGTDYLNKDSDGDGLLDGEEVKVEIEKRKMRNTVGFRDAPQYNVTLKATSNNTKIDSDGDGLFDNAKEIDKTTGEIILPIDPDKMKPNGPLGVWQKENLEISINNYGTKLKEQYEAEIPFPKFWLYKIKIAMIFNQKKSLPEKIEEFEKTKTAEELGSYILRFKRDDNENEKTNAIHSQVETWQKFWGYNDVYDDAFNTAVEGRMRREKFECSPRGNSDHIVWIWRGTISILVQVQK